MTTPRIAGVLLAAGSGARFGGPKALADTGDGPWVLRALAALDSLRPRVVVVGAAAGQVRALLSADVRVIDNPAHAGGMGSSLAAALAALRTEVDAVVVMLVDLPDVRQAAVRRVIDAATGQSHQLRDTLARAGYRGEPGHPVLIGAEHFAGVIEAARGDRGARDYLKDQAVKGGVIQVDCGDLGTGDDRDE